MTNGKEQCPYFIIANIATTTIVRTIYCLGIKCGRYNECHGLRTLPPDQKVVRIKSKKVKK